MAMLVIMLLALLAAAAVDRVIAVSHRTTHERDRSAALEAADAALAVGLSRVDHGEVAAFTQLASLGTAQYRIDATPSDPDNWVLVGTGSRRSANARFTATITRDRLYPYVLFTVTGSQISGPATAIEGPVGSSAHMEWIGLAATFEQHLVGASATCNGCTNPVVDPADRTYTPAPRPDDAEARACPAGGIFTGTIDGMAGAPVRCETGDVTFAGTVTVVNGPLVVWIGPGRALEMAGAVVNAGGAAEEFVVHKVDGGADIVDLEGATIVGVVDAPSTPIHVTTLDLTGAIVAGSFDDLGSGTDQIHLRVDPSVVDAPGYAWWRIIDRRQNPLS
jgi:Tfp pilus assembly protein PilX